MNLHSLLKYSLGDFIYLLYCLLRTKLVFSRARLIRFPIDIRNRRGIVVGNNFTTGKYCRMETDRNVKHRALLIIGNNVQINDFVHISAWNSVVISDDVLIASRVYISDVSHGSFDKVYNIHLPPQKQPLNSKFIYIQKKVWIGENVCILPGVIIGECSIIGAGSVVTKSIPSYSIAVGNPAKVIKRYSQKNKKWEKTE